MATVEQSLGDRLRKEGVLRLPVSHDTSRYGDLASVQNAASERMRRIVERSRCSNVDVRFEGDEIVAEVQ